jgi:hypothetical protein
MKGRPVAKVWVQLRVSKYIETQGKQRVFNPGDWVSVGKQTAVQWIAAGDAINFRLGAIVPPGCGIVARGGAPQGEHDYLGVPISNRANSLPYPRTLIWDATKLALRTNILPVGFNLLAHWQVVAPLWSYDDLACNVGSEEDRERVKAIVRDLRVPVYDTRMIFMRRCKDTQCLLALWREKEREITDSKLAFLAATYEVKPVICAQPTSWTRKV